MATYEVDVSGKTYEVDAPDPNTAWQWANQHHATLTQAREQATQQEIARGREAFLQSERERPLVDRIRSNVGAGFHNLVQGVAGIPRLFGADVGPTADDVAEHRALKDQLADTTAGGKLYQMAGEIAPTLLLPSGALGTGARVIGRVFPKTLAARAGDIALTGGLISGATTPGGWAERGLAAGLGAAGGAAVPVLSAGGKGVYRMARPTAGGRVAGREAAIAERMARDIGEEGTQQLATKLDQPLTEFERAGVARPTAAQLTRDPTLQQLETGLRTQRPDLFKAIDEAAATGRWDKLGEIARDEQALAAATKARTQATDTLREGALEAAGKVKGFEGPVAQAADAILAGPSRTIPQARTLANWVQKELAEGVTPEQLYSMRKTLTSGIPHGTELGSAMTQARAERMALVSAIDDALEGASGGQWTPYLRAYQELSQPVTSMKAGQAMQKAFENTANRTDAGLPVMTAHVLRKTLAKQGAKQFGSKVIERITPDERATVEAIARSIEAENAGRMAQGIIGSRTAGNVAASDRVTGQLMRSAVSAATGGAVPAAATEVAAHALGGWATKAATRARQDAYAELLADPERLRQALIAASKTMGREQAVGELARGTRGIPGLLNE